MSGALSNQQLLIVAALVLAFGAFALWIATRRRHADTDPVIDARFRRLKEDWYQLHIAIANRTRRPLVAVSLRRVWPRSARLMPPIALVNTKQGDFQVWSDPALDKTAASIPLDVVVRPGEARLDASAPRPATETSAWLFLKRKAPAQVTLELIFRTEQGRIKRCRFAARSEQAPRAG